jgi:hypothetical protein
MFETACCGNDCLACPRYAATVSGDEARLQEVAALWRRIGWRDRVVSPREIACHGCSTATWCRYGLRECARDRGVPHCGRCPDYPCAKLSAAWEATGSWARVCGRVCSPEEYAVLETAFFQKQDRLDRANRSFKEEKGPDA